MNYNMCVHTSGSQIYTFLEGLYRIPINTIINATYLIQLQIHITSMQVMFLWYFFTLDVLE